MAWLHAVIDVPAHLHDTEGAFWSDALGWRMGPTWAGHPELRSFEPPAGSAYVHLQEIGGAPRVHLDLEAADPAATVDRAIALGAELVAEHEDWQTLTSPGGFPFCVLTASERTAPDPTTWAEGHRSRLVQVCVDAPVDAHDREVSFWRALLDDGRWVDSSSREFSGKWHDDDGSPLQLLFQRLDEPTGLVRAHLDLGTDDLDAESTRLLGLGADDISPGRGWHALRDPAGIAFCATSNSPEQTAHRDLG
jgi:hypothetical protein